MPTSSRTHLSRLTLVLGGVLLALFVVATAAARSAGRPYKSTVFHPAFRLELPKGWVVAERGPDVAQIYRRCGRCAHEGEENGEITFDMALAKLSPAKAIALLRRTPGIRATRVRSVAYGTLRGLGFTAKRTGGGFEFPRSGYRSDPTGAPLKVSAVPVAGSTVTVFIDPHELAPAKAPAFTNDAIGILKTVRFTK
jgi:hypothetical protein